MATTRAAISRFAPAPASLCLPAPALDQLESFTLGANIWPTTPEAGEEQMLIGRRRGDAGFALVIGRPAIWRCRIGNQLFATGKALRPRQWYAAEARYDAGTGLVEVTQTPLGGFARDDSAGQVERPCPSGQCARRCLAGHGRGLQRQDRGACASSISPAAWWGNGISPRISAAPASSICRATALHGETVNLPTRGMTGAAWSGQALHWRSGPISTAPSISTPTISTTAAGGPISPGRFPTAWRAASMPPTVAGRRGRDRRGFHSLLRPAAAGTGDLAARLHRLDRHLHGLCQQPSRL